MRELEDVRREEYKRQVREREEKERQERAIRRAVNSVLEKIRAEIEKAMHSAQEDSRITQDDIDCGICAGIQRAIDIIDKYKDKGVEE